MTLNDAILLALHNLSLATDEPCHGIDAITEAAWRVAPEAAGFLGGRYPDRHRVCFGLADKRKVKCSLMGRELIRRSGPGRYHLTAAGAERAMALRAQHRGAA